MWTQREQNVIRDECHVACVTICSVVLAETKTFPLGICQGLTPVSVTSTVNKEKPTQLNLPLYFGPFKKKKKDVSAQQGCPLSLKHPYHLRGSYHGGILCIILLPEHNSSPWPRELLSLNTHFFSSCLHPSSRRRSWVAHPRGHPMSKDRHPTPTSTRLWPPKTTTGTAFFPLWPSFHPSLRPGH